MIRPTLRAARACRRPRPGIGLWLLGIATVVAAVGGCSRGSSVTRFDVSGTVTFGGAPVRVGTITFVPIQGNVGPGGSAAIRDGAYDTAASLTGPTAGPHVAIITGFDGKSAPGLEGQEGVMLFHEYKEEVDLPKEKTGRDFDVPASAKVKPMPPPPPGRKA